MLFFDLLAQQWLVIEPLGGCLQEMQAAFYRSVGDMTGSDAATKLTAFVHEDRAKKLGTHTPIAGTKLGGGWITPPPKATPPPPGFAPAGVCG